MRRSRRSFLKAVGAEATLPALAAAGQTRPQGSVPEGPRESAGYLWRGPYLQCLGRDRVIVRWRTGPGATQGAVRFGLSLDRVDRIVQAESKKSKLHEGLDWTARLDGLLSDHNYYYAIENSKAILSGYDTSYSFRTAPAEGISKATRFWVLGDCGTNRVDTGNPGKSLLARNGFRKYRTSVDRLDGILLLGDNAYSHGTDAQYQTAFFQPYQEELRNLPVWPCIGNHELTDDYLEIFEVPRQGELGGVASGSNCFYSFDWVDVHFTVLDLWKTEWRNREADQIRWLEKDLKSTDRPWKIVVNHFPPYCDGKYESDTNGFLVEVREKIMPILDDHGVDMLITGHDHTYQRSYLLDGHYGDRRTFDPAKHMKSKSDGRREPIVKGHGPHSGMVTVVTGTAGAEQPADPASPNGPQLDHPAMVRFPGGDQKGRGFRKLGTFLLEVDGLRLNGKQIDDQGAVLDDFTIVKERKT